MVVLVVRVGRSEVDICPMGAHEATLGRRNAGARPANGGAQPAKEACRTGQLAGGVNVSRSPIPSAASIAATRSII